MLGIGLWSLWGRVRGRLYDMPWLHRAAVLMGPSGFAAVLAGWITTEVGPPALCDLWSAAHRRRRKPVGCAPRSPPRCWPSSSSIFTVFGIGVWYILKLMGKAPHAGEYGVKRGDSGPIRTAGITPGPTQNPGGGESLPSAQPEKEKV